MSRFRRREGWRSPNCCINGKFRYSLRSNPGAGSGNDRLKTIVGAGGLSSPAVNLSHTLFRPENPVFCTVNARMNRHFMQLTGSPVHGAARTPRRTA